MKRLLPVLVLLALFPGVARADGAASLRFVPLAIHLDSPAAVAAWQFELKDRNGAMKVVGVENGGHPAFPRAPYYDREAVAGGGASRIVVADYSLADESLLPVGRVHLATLHLMLEGEPDFELHLITATTPEGSAIDASISFADLNDNPQERSQ